MRKRKVNRMQVLFLCVMFMLAGCGGIEQNEEYNKQDTLQESDVKFFETEKGMSDESEIADEFFVTEYVESEIVEQISATEENGELDVSDYSAYLKKIWIVDGWEEGGDYPVSLVITEVEKGNVCGYLKFDENVLSYYCNMNSYGKKYVCSFQGTVYDGRAECEYIDYNHNKQGVLKILFCDNDRIKVELEGNETKQYLLRPYNISDEKFSEELTTIEVELDSWGTVYLAYGNYDSRHSIPQVMLINNQGDILYIFSGNYQHGSMVCDVVIEDIDGDGLKDIRVDTTLDKENPTSMFEAYFYQEENGLFYFEAYKMFVE